jgi:hypothetical protein
MKTGCLTYTFNFHTAFDSLLCQINPVNHYQPYCRSLFTVTAVLTLKVSCFITNYSILLTFTHVRQRRLESYEHCFTKKKKSMCNPNANRCSLRRSLKEQHVIEEAVTGSVPPLQ